MAVGACSPRCSRKPDGESDQDHAEHQCLRPHPPGEHQGADQRSGQQKQAINQRHDRTEHQQPASVADFEADGGAKHQGAGQQRPSRDHEDEGEHGNAGPQRRQDTDRDPEQAADQEPSPAFALARAAHGQHDTQDAIDEAIGGEIEDEREHRRRGCDEGHDAEQDRQDSAQRDGPPIVCEHRVLCARELGIEGLEPGHGAPLRSVGALAGVDAGHRTGGSRR